MALEQQLCVTAMIFIRTLRSDMITIWIAELGFRITGRGLIAEASAILKVLMSDKKHLME